MNDQEATLGLIEVVREENQPSKPSTPLTQQEVEEFINAALHSETDWSDWSLEELLKELRSAQEDMEEAQGKDRHQIWMYSQEIEDEINKRRTK